MATRSTPATKRTPVKKTAASTKKTPAKKPAVTHKKAHAPAHRTLRVTRETTPFFTFRMTRQSLYWLIFSLAILGLGSWTLYLNLRVIEIYDQIDQNNMTVKTQPSAHDETL